MNHYIGQMEPWPLLQEYSRTIKLPKSDVELFFYDTGSAGKPTIMMVHGLGDEADSWRHLIPGLVDKYRILAPDLPGFGRSALPNAALAPSYLLSVLIELLDQLDLSQAILVGSSLGALLCQQISLEIPERVTGLVLLDGTLVASGQSLNLRLLLFLIPGIGEWFYKRLRKDPKAAFETLRPYYADLNGLPQRDKEFLFRRVNQRVWSEKQRKAYFSTLRQLALWTPRQQKELPGRLSRCRVPTLAIWGKEDAMVSVEAGRKLTQLQPTARLELIDEAGHMPHQERPQSVLETIQKDGRLIS